MGGLGTDVQHRADLLRREALRRRGKTGRQVPGEIPGRACGSETGRSAGRENDTGAFVLGTGLARPLEAGRRRDLSRREGGHGRQAYRASWLLYGADHPDDIKPENPAFREEFFGPVALFFRVKDEDAAIALANDSDFGLGGSVFTKSVARGKRVASRVDTGMMFINSISWSDAELPFGGIRTPVTAVNWATWASSSS